MNKKIIFITLLITIIGCFIYDTLMGPFNFRMVVPNVLYRSGALSWHGFRDVYKSVKLKSIIDLRSKKEQRINKKDWYSVEKRFAKRHKIKVYYLDMKRNTPPTKKEVKEFFKIMRNFHNFPALIHCGMGVNRTGMLVAAYQIAFLNENNDEVLKYMPMFDHHWANHAEELFIHNFDPYPYLG